eukprot:g10058.t1
MRMIQAAEAASLAAKTAAEALSRKNSGEESWFKVLPKPNTFDAKNREEELTQWRDFSWSLEQYLSSLNGMFTEDFRDIRARPDDPIDPSIQSDEEKQRSKFLYSLLASLVKQRPLAMLRQVKESNGMEAYRLLVQSLEPASKNRALGLLTMILEWKPFEMRKGSILGQVLRLEEAFVEYEKTGSKLEDNIRFAVLMRCIGGQLKTWLQLNVADRVGEQEHQDFERTHIEKGKIMRVAKYLNRIILLSGLELAAGSKLEESYMDMEVNFTIPFHWMVLMVIFGFLMFAIVILWNKVQALEKRVIFLINRIEMDSKSHREAVEQQDRENSMTADYVERVHRGLIVSGGHVEEPSVQRLEWQSLHYLEEINRWHEGLKLRKRWSKMEAIQAERGEQPPGYGIVNIDVDPGEPGLSGATAVIVLDAGRIVEVPVEYVEPREESADGVQATTSPVMEPEPSPGEDEVRDESMGSDDSPPEVVDAAREPEGIKIPDGQYAHFNRAYNRADLVSREELLKMEANWFHGHRNGNRALMAEMQELMQGSVHHVHNFYP